MGDPQWLVYWEILKITWMHLGYPHFRKRPYGKSTQKISFGGIPNSRNVLCLQIFLKRVMRSQALETPQLGFRLNGHKSCWTWPVALHQSVPDLLRNLLRNPVEPDLALHQSLPKPSPEPSLEPCWTWPGSAPKPPRPFPEPSLEPCWTWPGSAPKPPRPSPEPSPEPCWTWPGSAPKPPGNLLRNLLRNPVEPDLALHQSLPDLLRKLRRNLVEPDPGPCTSAHRSYSGLKTALAYAVGDIEQEENPSTWEWDMMIFNFVQPSASKLWILNLCLV